MKLTENDRLKQVTSDTPIVGVDVGSRIHCCRAFAWRGFGIARCLSLATQAREFLLSVSLYFADEMADITWDEAFRLLPTAADVP